MIAPVRWGSGALLCIGRAGVSVRVTHWTRGRAALLASFGNDRSPSLVDYQKSTANARTASLMALKMTPSRLPKKPDSFTQNTDSSATIYFICVDTNVNELG